MKMQMAGAPLSQEAQRAGSRASRINHTWPAATLIKNHLDFGLKPFTRREQRGVHLFLVWIDTRQVQWPNKLLNYEHFYSFQNTEAVIKNNFINFLLAEQIF